ncbi:hypothetical protein F8388_001951 [Cannabis sativa]|uniref:Uncharacterized protein n=1 Tax=Cannabis sativa TaxID=3483 RepID=A0A7J6FL36_CANSA|nr:hypothetical protein F8388_001951 [Cannabis sativa]KAF4398613.1 hypothetical protein G4B88_013702 [Cannabis sativa]
MKFFSNNSIKRSNQTGHISSLFYDNTLWGGSVALPVEAVHETKRSARQATIDFSKAIAADPQIQISLNLTANVASKSLFMIQNAIWSCNHDITPLDAVRYNNKLTNKHYSYQKDYSDKKKNEVKDKASKPAAKPFLKFKTNIANDESHRFSKNQHNKDKLCYQEKQQNFLQHTPGP